MSVPSTLLASPLHNANIRRQVAMRKIDDATMSALRRQGDSLTVLEQQKRQAHCVPVVAVLPSRCMSYLRVQMNMHTFQMRSAHVACAVH